MKDVLTADDAINTHLCVFFQFLQQSKSVLEQPLSGLFPLHSLGGKVLIAVKINGSISSKMAVMHKTGHSESSRIDCLSYIQHYLFILINVILKNKFRFVCWKTIDCQNAGKQTGIRAKAYKHNLKQINKLG